ncbi:MAG TPA: Ran-binding zinc finger domain-containing protein [Gemmatimonadaceae bacterium]|nr:Ran-binding zinc finger domain-containing protein [Gemmatimonadaceae bacterium]
MTKKLPNSSLDIVTALMEERAKFETWLATLESRRDTTPPNVYDRVRHDYETRLAGVVDELKTHAAELEAQAERYTTQLAELAERENARRDARAEAELRAHVGELSPDEWDATAKEADDALAAIAAEQAVAGADLNRVHELLGAAMGASPAAAEPEPAPRRPEPPAQPHPAPAGRPLETEAHAGPPSAAANRTPEQASFDELAFLKSVVSPRSSQTPVKSSPKPANPTGPQITQDQSDTLAESLASGIPRAPQDGGFIRSADAADPTLGLVGKAAEPDRRGERPYAANVTGNQPIVLRPSGAVEQPKTLKCAECGAMNYPTEWYCERCGAELAAL